MSYYRQLVIAKIQAEINYGKDPFYSNDSDINGFREQDREGWMDEVAIAQIKLEAAQGKDSFYSNNSYVRLYQDRCKLRNSKSSNSSYPSPGVDNSAYTKTVLLIEETLQSRDIEVLSATLEIVKSGLNNGGNPGCYITKLFDLKNQLKSKLRSIDSSWESTLRNRKAEAERKAQAARYAEAERQRVYNISPAVKAKVAAKRKKDKQLAIGILISIIVVGVIILFLNTIPNIGNIIGATLSIVGFVIFCIWAASH
jgi:hypothetical protein